MRGRSAGDDIVGRAAEQSLREGAGEDAVRARQTGETAPRSTVESVHLPGEATDDSRRIRSEIERTRGDMSETIDEIQNRLSPRNVAAQARDALKEKTVGRVRQLAGSASSGASDLATRTRDVARDTVGENPWPAILMGVGAAWLLFDRSRNRSNRGYRTVEREYHDDGTTGYYEVEGDRAGESGRDAWISTADQSGERYYRGSAWRDEEREPGRLAQASRDALGRARSNVGDFASQTRHLMQRNPLVVGAVAAAVGVAVGLALPETERENRLMGETRDTLIDRAQGAAHDAVEKVKEKAQNATKLL